ncbi:hypothetical protein AB0E63_33620 [Kribbella sp. NPDC026596]|uniref:hypothetical protein n=1 Tax=Kribbella sp. NPDC026596 TaxID=3155122 RepID=UPI0033E2814A
MPTLMTIGELSRRPGVPASRRTGVPAYRRTDQGAPRLHGLGPAVLCTIASPIQGPRAPRFEITI